MVRFLESQEFSIVRIRGSHHIMARQEVRTSVPVHGGQTLKIGTLRGILRDIDLSAYDFARLWTP
jgi:predicted RNA binding protein YcfA (HicA-like mRNA interferase family)